MYDYLAKIILLGPSGAGKSCILHRFVKNECTVSPPHMSLLHLSSRKKWSSRLEIETDTATNADKVLRAHPLLPNHRRRVLVESSTHRHPTTAETHKTTTLGYCRHRALPQCLSKLLPRRSRRNIDL